MKYLVRYFAMVKAMYSQPVKTKYELKTPHFATAMIKLHHI